MTLHGTFGPEQRVILESMADRFQGDRDREWHIWWQDDYRLTSHQLYLKLLVAVLNNIAIHNLLSP